MLDGGRPVRMHDRHVGVAEDEKKGRREEGQEREEGSRESGRECLLDRRADV